MVYFKSDNIISSLGVTTLQNYESMKRGEIGIRCVTDKNIYHDPFFASIINTTLLEEQFAEISHRYNKSERYTRLEKMIILSVHDALCNSDIDASSFATGFVISTTKGNIDLLDVQYPEKFDSERLTLWKLGQVIAHFFDNPNTPIVISNACISGVIAISKAAMLIEQKKYKNIIVTGGDIISKFVVSGFMSFLSLSAEPCKPFDKHRDGLSMGEGASTIILGTEDSNSRLMFRGGGSANDANHISGPSRTGEGSFLAIKRALQEAEISPQQIDHISAHGTATPYNDEMESIAIDRHQLNKAHTNSIKGYIGHTLGAAGLVETSVLLEEMRRNEVLKSAGYTNHGVTRDITISTNNVMKNLITCLKMASGFGGSNAAIVIQKTNS